MRLEFDCATKKTLTVVETSSQIADNAARLAKFQADTVAQIAAESARQAEMAKLRASTSADVASLLAMLGVK